jgi:hypothetical protein
MLPVEPAAEGDHVPGPQPLRQLGESGPYRRCDHLRPILPTAFALENLHGRGELLIVPGEQVYEGMMIGEEARQAGPAAAPTLELGIDRRRRSGHGAAGSHPGAEALRPLE